MYYVFKDLFSKTTVICVVCCVYVYLWDQLDM